MAVGVEQKHVVGGGLAPRATEPRSVDSAQDLMYINIWHPRRTADETQNELIPEDS